jgi:TonB family protein
VKPTLRFRFLITLGFGVICTAAFAQTELRLGASKGNVAVLNLVNPVYPPLAREANITGDVEIKLEIRKDGGVQSASVVSGPPMLAPAALTSAQQSQFECQQCEDEVTTYLLTYSFQITASPGWPCPEKDGTRITQLMNHVTATTDPSMVDPYFSNFRVRSLKCLYLWQCGSQWGGYDYYYYRVRSPKCLGLWNCGRRLREPFATCNKLHRKIL